MCIALLHFLNGIITKRYNISTGCPVTDYENIISGHISSGHHHLGIGLDVSLWFLVVFISSLRLKKSLPFLLEITAVYLLYLCLLGIALLFSSRLLQIKTRPNLA